MNIIKGYNGEFSSSNIIVTKIVDLGCCQREREVMLILRNLRQSFGELPRLVIGRLAYYLE